MGIKFILLILIIFSGCNTAEITTTGSVSSFSLSSISNTTTIENEPKELTFQVLRSSRNLCSSSNLSISSTNATVIPLASAAFSGTNSSCKLTITPALNMQGTSFISVILKHSDLQVSESFSLTVGPPLPLFTKDTSFGLDSLFSINRPLWDYVGGSEIDSNGNLLLSTSTWNPGGPNYADTFLHSINTELGTLDPTFNSTGEKQIDFGGDADYTIRLYVEADGKILSTYASSNGSGQYLVSIVRLLPDGSFDPSFGGGDGSINTSMCGSYCSVFAIQKVGNKYYVAGNNYNSQDVVFFRLEENGDLDATMPIRQFDPDPAAHKITGSEMITDGTHFYSLYRTDSQYEPASIENYILCKFDLAGASVTAFGGTGCLVINGGNTATRNSGFLLMDEGNTNLILAGYKNNVPWVTKLTAATGATVSGFGVSGDLLISDVVEIMGLKLHPTLGLLVLSELLDSGKRTYGVDVYEAASGTKPLQNKLRDRFVANVHPTADFAAQMWSLKDETLFISGLLIDPPYSIVTQKLLIQE